MSTYSFPIRGKDFEHAGGATGRVKEMLKRIGADPPSVRRAMIAAYEAEMNVVIHADGGRMEVRLEPERLSVDVIDDGPGIPDVERAMAEGFSTAGPEARELGFGAGMGLPNIRRNTDRLTIHSRVGIGTRLSFSVDWRQVSATARADAPNSLLVREDRCKRCMACVRACPTQAIRIGAKGPEVLGHLCVDCAECIRACPSEALTIQAADRIDPESRHGVLVAPAFLRAECNADRAEFAAIARTLGFVDAIDHEQWTDALRRVSADWLRRTGVDGPGVVPVCPAAVNLLAMRFPTILDRVAPYETPMSAAGAACLESVARFVVACPGQRTALGGEGNGVEAFTPNAFRAACMAARPKGGGRTSSAVQKTAPASWVVCGAARVTRVFDAIERGQWPAGDLIEPYLCEGGCFGSPLSALGADLSRRIAGDPTDTHSAGVLPLAETRIARPGRRLGETMGQALDRLRQIDRHARLLPGTNCGVCGAPTCEALAEDVALGRASVDACPWKNPVTEQPS